MRRSVEAAAVGCREILGLGRPEEDARCEEPVVCMTSLTNARAASGTNEAGTSQILLGKKRRIATVQGEEEAEGKEEFLSVRVAVSDSVVPTRTRTYLSSCEHTTPA